MPPDSPSPEDQTAFTPPPSRAGSSGSGWTPPSVEHLQALLPQYEIISMLGHGGMGAVYKGKQKSLDRLVAIKILPPGLDDDDVKFAERFKNEARTMAKLMHPGIVAVFDFGETSEGQLYFVMEYVDGTDVAKMIAAQTRLPPEHALAVTAHVCDALAYAHANGVIHRDIKPANILINMQGQVKVADFGLAKMDDPAQRGLTMTGMTMGTPDFVAPEALVMGVNVDGRADLYAIGVMLYQMLTGEIPRGLFQMPGELTNGEIDPRFDGIIAKAMQTNRESRYQAATEIRRDLDVILTTPRIKQDASQVVAAVPQAAVKNVPGQRSVAQKPGGVRAPKKDAAPAAKPSPKSKTGPVIGIAATLVIAGALVVIFTGKKEGGVAERDNRAETPAAKPAQPIKVIEPPKAATASASNTAAWTDGLDEWLAAPGNAAKGTLTPEGSAHRMAESGCTLMLGNDLPMKSLANAAVRVRLRHSGAEAVDIHLREQAEAGNFYSATFTKTGATRIISRASMISADLAAFEPPAGFDAAASHQLEFSAEGEQLGVSLDGRLLGSVRDTRFASGQFSVTGKGALIESVEYRDLGKSLAVSGNAIDLLPLVDLKKDVIVGPWSIKDGELYADRTPKDTDEVYGAAFCTLPYTPPEEFDVDAEFTSHESTQASIILPLVGAKTQVECTFFYGSSNDRWHSLERLDDLPPYDPRQRKGEAAFKVTKPDFAGRHKAHVEVRRSSIKVIVDDVPVIDWTGDQKRLALSTDYTTLQRLNRVAIGRNGRPMTFHHLAVREVSGAGKLLDATRAVVDPWNDALAEWWQHVPAADAAGLLTKEAGGSRVNASPVRKAIFLGNETKRTVLTVKATVRDISDFCALYVRHQSPDNYQAVLQKDGTTKIVLTNADGRELARGEPIPGFDARKSHVFEFKADAGMFIVRVDGKETCRALDDKISKKGTFYFTGDSGTLIEKLEYR